MRIRSVLSHSTQAIAEGALISLLVVGLMAGTAFAGNGAGPNKSPSSISLVQATTAVTTSAASEPRYGDLVSFDISTTATVYPYVNLKCYQNGALVAQGWAAYFGGTINQAFGLYSPQWTGGAADCTAYLDMGSSGHWKVLASTSFHVAP